MTPHAATILTRHGQIGVVVFPPLRCAGCGEMRSYFIHHHDARHCLACEERRER